MTTTSLAWEAGGQQVEDSAEMTVHDLLGSHPTCLNDNLEYDPFSDVTKRTVSAVLQTNGRLVEGNKRAYASARLVLRCRSFSRCRNHVALGVVVLDRTELDRIRPMSFRLDSGTTGQETMVTLRVDSTEPWRFRWFWYEYGDRHGEARSLWTARRAAGGFMAHPCDHYHGLVSQVIDGDRVIAQVGGSSVFVFDVGEKRRPVTDTAWGPTKICLREFWERCETMRLEVAP